MQIPPPKHVIGDMNRAMECEELVHPVVATLVEQAQKAGWTADEMLLAIEEVVKDIRTPTSD